MAGSCCKLLLGGSPCTHWSVAQTKNRETEPSGVGWELFLNYKIALQKYKPDYFLYENNKSIAPAIRTQITAELGVEPILINSALVSAQSRQRLYWTNIPGVEQPEDRGLILLDILDSGLPIRENGYTLKANYASASVASAMDSGHFPATMVMEPVNITADGKAQCLQATYCPALRVKEATAKGYTDILPGECVDLALPNSKTRRGRAMRERSNCLTTSCQFYQYCGTLDRPIYEVRNGLITIKGRQYPIKLMDGFYIIRKLTVRECMRLQTVPEDFTFPVSDTQAYKMLGNGWTVDVIAHILSYCSGITTEPLEVLSMYDGMSCGHLALDKLGAHIAHYYATEIDKYAIQTTQANYPETIQLGDAFQVRDEKWNIF